MHGRYNIYRVLRRTDLKLHPVALVRKRINRPNDRRFSAKLVPTSADRACHVVSATDPHGR
jgi:hypothetical protein